MMQPLSNATLVAPVSIGELFDKITILQIKVQRIKDPDKLQNIHKELAELQNVAGSIQLTAEIDVLIDGLQTVNQQLWDIEDAIRDCERLQCFNAAFIDLARSVYQINDRRAELKRQINVLCGSSLCEEKSYADY